MIRSELVAKVATVASMVKFLALLVFAGFAAERGYPWWVLVTVSMTYLVSLAYLNRWVHGDPKKVGPVSPVRESLN